MLWCCDAVMLPIRSSNLFSFCSLVFPYIFAHNLRKPRNRANRAENRPLSIAEIGRYARKAVLLHYVVKLLELCRQTPWIMPSNEYKSNACINFVECRHYRRKSIMPSNYSQYRNKKNRAKNNETLDSRGKKKEPWTFVRGSLCGAFTLPPPCGRYRDRCPWVIERFLFESVALRGTMNVDH